MSPVDDHGASLRNVFTSLSEYHCDYIEEVKYPYEIEVNNIPPREIFEQAITVLLYRIGRLCQLNIT